MSRRAWHTVKGTSLVLAALAAWAVLRLTIAHSWHEETGVGVPAGGATGLWKLELVANLPEFVYFLVVGALLFYLSSPFRTLWWSIAIGVLAMVVKAVARNYTFHQGMDFALFGVLFVDLVLPAIFAVAGATMARMFLSQDQGAQRAT